MITTVSLDKLVASPRNVRRSSDPAADAELKADIEAHGLLQNLVVSRVRKPGGCFAVEAGERRRQALTALVAEGKLAKDHAIACLVVDAGSALEASLAENFQRLAMNPADECLAFQRLVEQGLDADAIARRFGVTVRFVQGRLRLADLAPAVFDALGSGEIGLEVAKAYAATADRERQAYVFDQVNRSYMAAHADTIRRMMTQATLSGSDRRARFVGEEAYVAAGGRIERDLFADSEDSRWLDIALVDQLASEKLEAAAAETAAETGLAWVRPVLGDWLGYGETQGLRSIEAQFPSLSEEETAEVDALEAEIEELAASIDEDEESAARDAAEAKMQELAARFDAIVSKPPVIAEELKETAGAFLLLDRAGRPVLDSRRFVAVPADGDEIGADDPEAGEPGDGVPGKSEGGPSLPRRLVDELAMQRRDILAVHVAADRDFAFDLATFLMVDGTAGYVFETAGSALRASGPSDPAPDFKAPELAASLALAGASEALDRSWTEGSSRAEQFDAFRALPEVSRKLWFALAVARTLEASAKVEGPRSCAFHDHLGSLLGIEVHRWWRPTAATYFDRVPKAKAIEALAEVGGGELANRYAKLKKAELAEACERVFAGDAIVEAAVKEAALQWVPEAMRFGAPDEEAASAADPAPDAPDESGVAAGDPLPDIEPELGQAA